MWSIKGLLKATNEHTLSYINPSPPVPGLFFGYSDDGEEESKRKYVKQANKRCMTELPERTHVAEKAYSQTKFYIGSTD